MSNTPILTLLDFAKVFVVEIDASSKAVGAVLSQEGHPLAFFSKKLGPKLLMVLAYV